MTTRSNPSIAMTCENVSCGSSTVSTSLNAAGIANGTAQASGQPVRSSAGRCADIGVEGPTFEVVLRGMHEPRARKVQGPTPIAALRAALNIHDYAADEPVIEWDGKERLAVLDVDFHGVPMDRRPSQAELNGLINRVQPRPQFAWTSHGRGLHCVYSASDGYTANELAAVASFSLRNGNSDATFEIVSHTRHPYYARPDHPSAGRVCELDQTSDLSFIKRLIGIEADDELVGEWLAEHGLERDHQYSHELCPLAPDESSHGTPVHVGDDGVYCHRCAARGSSETGTPGFISFSALVGGVSSNALRTAIRSFTHWEHARFIFDDVLGTSGSLAKDLYSAVLKVFHGTDDPRCRAALHRGAGLVRMDGYWATKDLSRAHKPDGLVARLRKLPALQYLVQDKKDSNKKIIEVDAERMGIFQGVDDLAPYGYPRLVPIRGMKIHGRWQPRVDHSSIPAVILPDFLQADEMRSFRPAYTPSDRRMNIQEAERVVERSFPGICWPYVRLLIAGRGCAEAGLGEPPKIAVKGPSGSGKTTTQKIAATFIGDRHMEVPYNRSVERFQLALFSASNIAGFVSCDELIKDIQAHGGQVVPQLTAFLTYGIGTMVRPLYQGPIPVRHVPLLSIADTDFPQSVQNDVQLGRRFVLVQLERAVRWQETANGGIEKWRTLDREHARAADAIVSDVIDRFFADLRPPVFTDVARQLDFGLLHESTDPDFNSSDDIRRLFEACCDPHAPIAPATTWRGRGWKTVSRSSLGPLAEAYRTVCDDLQAGFGRCRRLSEADLAAVLGVAEPVTFDIREHGHTVGIRFRVGAPRSPSMQVNEQIAASFRRGEAGVQHLDEETSASDTSPPSLPAAPAAN